MSADIVDEAGRGFDGYGIGGALEKQNLGTIVRWVCEELPEDRPRHLLGISEPDDMFTAIENGADTFDCVSPSRVARNGSIYVSTGRYNLTNARFRPTSARWTTTATATPARTTPGPTCTICSARRRCCRRRCATIHNERFVVRLVDRIRAASATARSPNSARTSWVGTTRRVHNKTMTTAAVLDLSNRANTYPDYTRRSVSVDLCSW